MRVCRQEERSCCMWSERAARLFCICVWTVAVYVGVKYLFPVLAPFFVAFTVSAVVSWMAKAVSKKLHIPYALCAALVMTALMLVVGIGMFYFCRQLLTEIKRTLATLSVGGITDLERIFSIVLRIPALSGLVGGAQEIKSDIYEIIRKVLSAFGGSISTFLGSAIRATPTFFVGSIVTVVSCYYMSLGFDGICAFIKSLLPKRAADRAGDIKNGFFSAIGGYMRAYAMLFVLTFVEALVGLLILCPAHAWLGALAVAAVDVLPVFGAGFILIPWGIVSIMLGEHFLGIGLLVLYVIMTVVRQIAEPKIVGENLGSHPLGTMIAMFAGYRLFGIMGMLLCPVVLSVALKSMKKHNQTCA